MATQQSLANGRQLLAARTQGGVYNGGGSAYTPGKNDNIFSMLIGGGLDPAFLQALASSSSPQNYGNGIAQREIARKVASANTGQPGNVLPRSGSVGGPGGYGASMGGVADPSMMQSMQQGIMGNQVAADATARQNKLQQELQRAMLRDKIDMITKFFSGGGAGGMNGQTTESNTYGQEYHNVGGRPVGMPTRQRQVQTTKGFDPNELIRMLLG